MCVFLFFYFASRESENSDFFHPFRERSRKPILERKRERLTLASLFRLFVSLSSFSLLCFTRTRFILRQRERERETKREERESLLQHHDDHDDDYHDHDDDDDEKNGSFSMPRRSVFFFFEKQRRVVGRVVVVVVRER